MTTKREWMAATGTGLALALTLGVAPANATTVRVDFSGTVLSYHDMATGVLVQSAVGTTFSGFLSYNVGDPEYSVAGLSEYGQPRAQAFSDSGCSQLTNGVCVNDLGSNPPLVLDYRFTYSQVDYSPLQSMLGYSDGSQRYNQSVGGAPSGEEWAAARNQTQIVVTGNPVGDYEISYTQRIMYLIAWIAGDGLLDHPASDLTQGFNFGAVPNGQTDFGFLNILPAVTTCTYNELCDQQYGMGSFDLRGTLTSVSFSVVPEPGTFAILALGLAGLGTLQRRRLAA